MSRRRTFEDGTAPELEERIDEYFASRWQTRKITQRAADGSVTSFEEPYMRPPTLAGLALALDTTRMTLLNYKAREEFLPVINRALTVIAEFAEEALYTREGHPGARFSLEVNHRYGREEEVGSGNGFNQLVISPAIEADRRAIPKWNEETDE